MKDEILKWRRNFGSSTALWMSLSKLFEQPSSLTGQKFFITVQFALNFWNS